MRFSFAMFLKCDVVTFKKTIYMLPEYCVEDRIGSTVLFSPICSSNPFCIQAMYWKTQDLMNH